MIFCSIFFLVGIIFLAIGLVFLRNNIRRERNYNGRTTALVIDIVKKELSTSSTEIRSIHHHPVLEFYANGRHIKNTYFVGSNPCKYVVGQNVTVRYDINNPEKYFIEGEKLTKILGIVFTIIGVVVITVGISVLVYLG